MSKTVSKKHWARIGWAATLLGSAVWIYGYFASGSSSIMDWPAFAPHWIAEYLPNWQAEVGMAFMVLGSIPFYYAQIQDYRQRG
jgi:hypothetical protein